MGRGYEAASGSRSVATDTLREAPRYLACQARFGVRFQKTVIHAVLEHVHRSEKAPGISSKAVNSKGAECPRLTWSEMAKKAVF